MDPRYIVTVVSVGDTGLAARPAVVERDGWAPGRPRTVKVYRVGEEHLAEKLAAELNGKEQAA